MIYAIGWEITLDLHYHYDSGMNKKPELGKARTFYKDLKEGTFSHSLRWVYVSVCYSSCK